MKLSLLALVGARGLHFALASLEVETRELGNGFILVSRTAKPCEIETDGLRGLDHFTEWVECFFAGGSRMFLWRAVDLNQALIGIMCNGDADAQKRRSAEAAPRFL